MAKQVKKTNEDGLDAVDHPESELLNPEVCKVIKELNPEQQSIIIKAIRSESFSGPIPHPELLIKYEQVQPGFAERIVEMAEKQLGHRIECEDKVVNGSVSESKRGQCFGLIVAVLFLCAATALGLTGHDWLGGVLGGGTLVALVTVFVNSKHRKDNNE